MPTLSPDDPRWTAYALGELEGEERRAVEAFLAADEAARREIEEIRGLGEALRGALAAEEAPALTPEVRAALREGERPDVVIRPRRWSGVLWTAGLAAALAVFAGLAWELARRSGPRAEVALGASARGGALEERAAAEPESRAEMAAADAFPGARSVLPEAAPMEVPGPPGSPADTGIASAAPAPGPEVAMMEAVPAAGSALAEAALMEDPGSPGAAADPLPKAMAMRREAASAADVGEVVGALWSWWPEGEGVGTAVAPLPEGAAVRAVQAAAGPLVERTLLLNASTLSAERAAASLEAGQLPPAVTVRTEEFVQAVAGGTADRASLGEQPVGAELEWVTVPGGGGQLLGITLSGGAADSSGGAAPAAAGVVIVAAPGAEPATEPALPLSRILEAPATLFGEQVRFALIDAARPGEPLAAGAVRAGDPEASAAVDALAGPDAPIDPVEAMETAYRLAQEQAAAGAAGVVVWVGGLALLPEAAARDLAARVATGRNRDGIPFHALITGRDSAGDVLLAQLAVVGEGRVQAPASLPEARAALRSFSVPGLGPVATHLRLTLRWDSARTGLQQVLGYEETESDVDGWRGRGDNLASGAEVRVLSLWAPLAAEEGESDSGAGDDRPAVSAELRYRLPGSSAEREIRLAVPPRPKPWAESSPALRRGFGGAALAGILREPGDDARERLAAWAAEWRAEGSFGTGSGLAARLFGAAEAVSR